MKEVRFVTCEVEQIKVGLGTGGQLLLFRGDRIKVKSDPNFKGRCQVLNGRGEVIGTLTKSSLERIAGERKVNKKGEKSHALEVA